MPSAKNTPGDALDEWLGSFVVFGALLAALTGAALCVGCIVWQWWPFTGWGQRFYFSLVVDRSPLMLAWALLISATGALSWAGMPAGWRACQSGWKRVTKEHRIWLVTTVVLLVFALMGMPMVSHAFPLDVEWPLKRHSARVTVISTVVMVPALTAIVGMWFTAVAAFDSLDKEQRQPRFEIAIFLQLSRRLQSLLWYVGIVIGCAILSTGTLRRAMLAGGWAEEDAFPQELVLAYGAYYTLLLIISYLGPYALMQRAGDRLVGYLADDGGNRDKSGAVEWQQRRVQLAEMLKLGSTLQESLLGTLAILAPILGGLLSLALPD